MKKGGGEVLYTLRSLSTAHAKLSKYTMANMSNSARLRKATQRFDKNVTRKVPTNAAARVKNQEEGYGLGPIMLAFFAFVVIGSSLLEIFRPN